jgi:hypothetical protein
LDGITLYVQVVNTSCLGFNPSFEPDMKYWQIEHTGRFHPKVLNQTSWTYTVIPSKFWTRHEEQTSGWNHPVCSTCLFFLSDSKLLDWIFLFVQFVSTCLVQNV